MKTNEIKRVVLPKVLRADMAFLGEELASVSTREPDAIRWVSLEVYRIHKHPKPLHPSNSHVGKFIVAITKASALNNEENKITYVHCATPQEVVNALYQPWNDGSYVMTSLSESALSQLMLNEPENFENTIK